MLKRNKGKKWIWGGAVGTTGYVVNQTVELWCRVEDLGVKPGVPETLSCRSPFLWNQLQHR